VYGCVIMPINPDPDWKKRLDTIVTMMREMSLQTDPQAMVRAYSERIRQILPTDRMVSLSRRGLTSPKYRITRSNLWSQEVNPWKDPQRLPLFDKGLLGELLYSDMPRVVNDLKVSADDPAAEYFEGQKSLISIPQFDAGVATNMVVLMRKVPDGFDPETLPEWVWTSGLFGRATHNLVLSEDLKKAYDVVDQELKVIAGIQRSLLPATLPKIDTLDLAVHYETSRRAGGDYYDFFPLPDNRWGILLADVSGHGTPAAVMMAITHSIAHAYPGPPTPPANMLTYLNHQLATRYTRNGTFVTAFYGIYDARQRTLRYSSAGHNPPRLKRCADGTMQSLDGAVDFPLGIVDGVEYEDINLQLQVGDQIIFYTDGITEAQNPTGEMFGVERLDETLQSCSPGAKELIRATLENLEKFAAGHPADDDRTLLVAKVR
jgi:sigma-B regulation protein RsbU (phosphoserine phosphatase)